MPNFDFLGKGLGLIYPPDFLYDFLIFLMLYILLDQIQLSDYLYSLSYLATGVSYLLISQVVTS